MIKCLLTVVLAIGISGLLTACGKGSFSSPAPRKEASCAFTGDGCVRLAWDPVTQDLNGNPVTISGYKIYWGVQPGVYPNSKDIGNVTEGEVLNLAPGTYYFTASAYISSPWQESGKSNEVSSDIPSSLREIQAASTIVIQVR